MDNTYLRDRYAERYGLAWRVYIDKKLICDGFKTRQQAHDFIDTEIKPLMEKGESIKSIENMNEFNAICTSVDDYEGRQLISIGIGKPNVNLPDYDGI